MRDEPREVGAFERIGYRASLRGTLDRLFGNVGRVARTSSSGERFGWTDPIRAVMRRDICRLGPLPRQRAARHETAGRVASRSPRGLKLTGNRAEQPDQAGAYKPSCAGQR